MRLFSPTGLIDRRAFLTAAGGAFLAGLAPRAAAAMAEADAIFASAYLDGYGRYGVALLAEDGSVLHRYDLPERGHDAVFSPNGETLVVFARRPGTFAAAIDMRKQGEPLVIPRAGGPALLRPWLFLARRQAALFDRERFRQRPRRHRHL
jgi:hypothetical protein